MAVAVAVGKVERLEGTFLEQVTAVSSFGLTGSFRLATTVASSFAAVGTITIVAVAVASRATATAARTSASSVAVTMLGRWGPAGSRFLDCRRMTSLFLSDYFKNYKY